jgi:hypothetical protein
MMKREDAMKIAEDKLLELAQALEQGRITAVASNLIRVRKKYVPQTQKVDFAHLLGKLLQIVAKLDVDLMKSGLHTSLSLLVTNGCQHNRISVRGQYDLRVRSNRQQIEKRFVDDDRKTVAVFNQTLFHNRGTCVCSTM